MGGRGREGDWEGEGEREREGGREGGRNKNGGYGVLCACICVCIFMYNIADQTVLYNALYSRLAIVYELVSMVIFSYDLALLISEYICCGHININIQSCKLKQLHGCKQTTFITVIIKYLLTRT